MKYGPGESRYLFSEKKRLEKHVPLGELIYLDRERCIQCARCVRFQKDLVDDPVIGFSQRGPFRWRLSPTLSRALIRFFPEIRPIFVRWVP